MLEVTFKKAFLKEVQKLGSKKLKVQVKKLVQKIMKNPEIGKPMRNERKGTREVYMKPFRISYAYKKQELMIIFLDVYHKDEQ